MLGGGGGGGVMCRPSVYTLEDMCSLKVYVFPNFSCLCSLRYAFQPHSKVYVPSVYTISRFLIVFYVLSGSGSGSPGDTTPSILVPTGYKFYC